MFLPSSVINVQMVSLPGGSPQSARSVETAADSAPVPTETPAPAPVETESQKAVTPQPPKSTDSAPAEISVAPQPPRAKPAPLKYQTRRPQEPRPRAPQVAERQVTTPSPPPVNPLDDTIRRIRERVEQEGRPASAVGEGSGEGSGSASGRAGGFGFGGHQEVEAIDLYRLEVAFAVNRNWAFAEQLSGDRGERVASIVFKIMPDGRLEDIFFTDRSGNPYLDESAYRAIVKSSPVRPHPTELRRPYIEMGLRFTPKGVQ